MALSAAIASASGSARAVSPYMLFANEARAAISAESPALDLMGVAKVVIDRWAAMSEAERQAYEARAAEGKLRHEVELQARNKGTPLVPVTVEAPAAVEVAVAAEDSAATKAPAAVEAPPGASSVTVAPAAEEAAVADEEQVTPAKRKRIPTAYALFALDQAQRGKAAEQLKAASSETGAKHIAAALREMWKAMPASEKAPFEELREVERTRIEAGEELTTQHTTAGSGDAATLETEKAQLAEPAELSKPEEAAETAATAETAETTETTESVSVTPAKASSKRRARDDGLGESTKKRGRAAGKEPQAVGPIIEEAVLDEARSLGMERSLKNLASRSEIAAKGSSSQELLDALKQAEGLVNKAKQALLGA